jgi:hypothetical protein
MPDAAKIGRKRQQNSRFLATAEQLANYFINNLPPDYVPYWDFSQSSPAPRDVRDVQL